MHKAFLFIWFVNISRRFISRHFEKTIGVVPPRDGGCVVRVRYDSDGRKRRLLRGNHRHHVCLFAEREVGEITFGEAFTCHARTKKDSEIYTSLFWGNIESLAERSVMPKCLIKWYIKTDIHIKFFEYNQILSLKHSFKSIDMLKSIIHILVVTLQDS